MGEGKVRIMDAFKIIAMVESQQASNAFKDYFDKLNLKDEIREKITRFDPMNPLFTNGFHPAFALHMIAYNETL